MYCLWLHPLFLIQNTFQNLHWLDHFIIGYCFIKKKKLFSHWQCLCTNVSLFDQCEFCRLSFSWGSLQYFLNIIKTLFSFTDYKNKWILLIVILSAYFAFLFISSLRSYEIHSRIIGKYSAKMNKQMTPNPTIKM